ncbi:uncharacterized protein DS421_2g49470 [Arachis hypogaea]|nr:uncharacterized protein DS421_2g49470 [Arachis hypogaea]
MCTPHMLYGTLMQDHIAYFYFMTRLIFKYHLHSVEYRGFSLLCLEEMSHLLVLDFSLCHHRGSSRYRCC